MPRPPRDTDATPADRAFVLLQRLLPTHPLSRVVHWFMRLRIRFVKNLVIRLLMRIYRINLDEALIQDIRGFASFNEFFTRALKPGARPLPEAPGAVASPVDGRIYQAGSIEEGRIFQAKGHSFSAAELLGSDPARAAPFYGGSYATIYLAPHNYHRIHMPIAGRLREMVYVPGRLFSVNPATTRALPNLFARNERVAAIFQTAAGPMAVVLVGALFVGSIETVWAGEITPPRGSRMVTTRYSEDSPSAVELAQGAELGRFNMGSTVILLFGRKVLNWSDWLAPDVPVRMGQEIGRLV